MTRLIYSENARDDLNGVLDYISEHAPGTAVRFVEELMATCDLICTQPRMGARVDQIAAGLRRVGHKRYVIYYRYHEVEDVVRVSRVLHHALEHEGFSID